MNTSSDRTITLKTTITESQLNGLKKIVELGLAAAYGSETSVEGWTDIHLMEALIAAEDAEKAMRTINTALLDTEQNTARHDQWHIRQAHSTPDTAFWSDTHGWTVEGKADRYSAEEAFNTARIQVMASLGIVAHLHKASLHSHTGSEWVIYSPSAAEANENCGYWNASKGWVNRSNAGLHGYWIAGSDCYPANDCQWINLQLLAVTDEAGLIEALRVFCTFNSLSYQSADELLFAETESTNPHVGRIAWLEQFNQQWEQAISQGAEIQLAM
jgi:hypothetical protein